jgi:hypothetical protein
MALFQLIVKPHYWEKTIHGLHLGSHAPPADETWQEHNWAVMDRATTRLQAINRPVGDGELLGDGSRGRLHEPGWRQEDQPTMMLPKVIRSTSVQHALKKSHLTSIADGRPTMPMPAIGMPLTNGKQEVGRLQGPPADQSMVGAINWPLQEDAVLGTINRPLWDDSVVDEPTVLMPATRLNGHARLQDDYLNTADIKDHRSITSSITASLRAVVTLPMPAFSRSERARLFSAKNTGARDPWLYVTLVIACIACVAACCYSFQQQDILLYSDAYSHLRVARSVVDGSGLSIVQLGGVWLPLPHLLMLPFIWNDYLWKTGLAGSIPSMLCYLVSALYLYLAARALTNDGRASCIGALVFILNPNILYLQTTPLSDLVCFATLTIASYYFIRWTQADARDAPKQLIFAAASTFLATIASYDGWASSGCSSCSFY